MQLNSDRDYPESPFKLNSGGPHGHGLSTVKKKRGA
jgi:hypothetical protein